MKEKWIKTSAAWLLAFCMVVSIFQTVITAQAEESGVSDSTDWDAVEMNKTMPTAGADALAYMEFDSTNGTTYTDASKKTTMAGNWAQGYDISSSNTAVNNPLTLADVQSLSNEFSIVFRAKLEIVGVQAKAILSFSPDDIAASGNTWKNALSVGIVGSNVDENANSDNKTHRKYMYYEIRQTETSTGYTAPTKEGYTFAGWYRDSACSTPLATTVDSGAAFARFVSDDILCTKAQISNTYTASGIKYKSIRFITSVDSLNYSRIGFKFEIDGETFDCASDKVYSKLYAIGASSGTAMKLTPQGAFCEEATYFKTWTYTYIPESDFGTEMKAIPYWITQDGTTVEGAWSEKTINMGIMAAKMKSSSTLTADKVTQVMKVDQPWDDTNIITNSYSPQGGYTDGKYYYQAFIDCVKDAEDSSSACIAQFSMDGTLIRKFTNTELDHANDITYNSKLNRFIISHAKPNYTYISYFYVDETTNSLVYEKTEEVDYNIISIDYNEARDQYVVGLKYTQDFRILDSEFNPITPQLSAYNRSDGYTTQGVSCDENFVYFVLFKLNVIKVYDWNGNFVTNVNLENVLTSTDPGLLSTGDYEPENISVIDNEIYIGSRYNDSPGGVDSFTVHKITSDDIN